MSAVSAITRNAVLLGGFAALTTALIAGTYRGTREDIIKAERAAEARQLLEIFPPKSHDNDLIEDNFPLAPGTSLLKTRTPRSGYRVRNDGEVTGIILPATARDGYSGDIRLLVGIDANGSIAGVRVVAHRETPGLGDGIDLQKSDWILTFNGRSLTNPTEAGWAVTKDGGVFDQFTGATVTPRAVVNAVRDALVYTEANQPLLFETHSRDNVQEDAP